MLTVAPADGLAGFGVGPVMLLLVLGWYWRRRRASV
jgi:hypothetical protein